jgi:hypothetical protein
MATITLEYNPNNAFMQSYLDTAILAGFKIVKSKENIQKELTPFEKSLEDIKHGRVTRIKNVSNLLEECMQ